MSESELEEFSLADLADLNVDDIEEIRFEQNPAGVYVLEVKEAKLEEMMNKDNEKRFHATFGLEIIEVKAVLESGVDKESLVGKKQIEKLWINPGAEPEKVREAIGRIRAFVADMGCDNTGALGPMIENTKGHRFPAKIVKQKDKEDKTIEYSKVKFDPKKK